MKLSTSTLKKLLEDLEQREGSLKEAGFKLALNKIGLTPENAILKDIEITEEKQKELKNFFDDKYKELDENPSREVLYECVGVLEVLTFIGIKISVPKFFAESALCSRYSD